MAMFACARPLLLVAAFGLLACTPRFENATTVIDLRLLGVKAEPPEILIDLAAAAAAGTITDPLPPVVLTPLIVDPKGAARPVQIRVEACPNDPDEAIMGGMGMRPGMVGDTVSDRPCGDGAVLIADASLPAGPDGTVPFETTFTPTLPFLIEAARADPLGVELGLPVRITFTVKAGDETVRSFKRILFSQRLSPDHQPNQNPVVTRFFMRQRREDPREPLDATMPPVVPRGTSLRIAVAPAVAEAYSARAFNATERRFYTERVPEETLRYSFYATRGIFAPSSVSNDPSPLLTNPTTDLETTYEAPGEALPPGADPHVDVFVVVRDERAGASFTRTRLRVE